MFSLVVHHLDKKSSQYDPELDPGHPKFKSEKMARCFTALRRESFEALKQKTTQDISSQNWKGIQPFLSMFSKPEEVYNDWNWNKRIHVGIVLHTQHVEHGAPVLKTKLFETWEAFVEHRQFYFDLQPDEPGFFSSGAIVIYKTT